MDFKTWLVVASVLIALAALIDRIIERRRNSAEKLRKEVKESMEKQDDNHAKLRQEFIEACLKIAVLEKQMATFWGVIDKALAKLLHAPTHTRRDELLERLIGERPPPLTIEEVDELSCEMQAIIDAPNERIPGERMYAILMRGRLEAKKAKHELLKSNKVKTINQC